MRIIYFEDDEIDLRLFQRACRNIESLEIKHYPSYLELSDPYINSYDGIVLDQFLSDCSIEQFVKRDITIPTAVLSASNELNRMNPEDFIGVWQKPIKEEGVREIMQNMSDLAPDIISMTYIEDLTLGNETDRMELLTSIFSTIKLHIEKIESFERMAVDEVVHHLHNLKSKVGIFYLENLHKTIDNLEGRLRDGEAIEMIQVHLNSVISRTKKVLTQINNKIN